MRNNLLAFLIFVLGVATLGCGNSSDEFVFTNSTTNNANAGTLVFRFVQAQALEVSAATASLQFEFFDIGDNLVYSVTRSFASVITIDNVPASATRVRIITLDSVGDPLTLIDDDVSVVPGATSAVDLTGASVRTLVLNSVVVSPSPVSITVGSTAQVQLTGFFSQGVEFALNSSQADYSGNNENIATVNSSGVVTGISAGSTDLTVDYTIGGTAVSTSVTIQVSNASVNSNPSAVFTVSDSTFARSEDLSITDDNRLLVTWTAGANSSEFNVRRSVTSFTSPDDQANPSVGASTLINTTSGGGDSQLGVLPNGSGFIGWQDIDNGFAQLPFLTIQNANGSSGASNAVGNANSQLVSDLDDNGANVFAAFTDLGSPDDDISFHQVTPAGTLGAAIGAGLTLDRGPDKFSDLGSNTTHLLWVTSFRDQNSEVRGAVVNISNGATTPITIDSDTLQTVSRVGTDLYSDGTGVVVWADGPNVKLRTVDTSGNLGTVVAVAAGTAPDVVIDPVTGDYLVVSIGSENDENGIYLQRLSSSGQLVGQAVQVNTSDSESESTPHIDIDSNGNYAVVWLAQSPETGVATGRVVKARLFPASFR